jgi:hypothetical protein
MQTPASNRHKVGAFPPTSFSVSPSIHIAASQILAPMLSVLLLFGVLYHPSKSLAASNSQSSTHTRPCSSNPGLPPDSKAAKESSKNKSAETPAPPPACLEVKGAPLEFLEFLQAFIRGQKWRISQEQASVQGLSFVLYLEPEELARFAHTEILAGRIAWTEGRVGVQVTTVEAADGFTRVQVAAKFQGKGNTNEHFARPTNLLPLASKGTLEGSMIAALESRADPSRR